MWTTFSMAGAVSHTLYTLTLTLTLTFLQQQAYSSEVAVMHYGHFGGLSLTCQRDELILMESEVLGYSTNRGCAPQPQCSVPYTLAKWYCRGKSTCGGMQVERRPLHKRTCGSEFTNCLRVQYQCVPMSKLTDVCSDALYEAEDGYIRSPSFPEMYPPDKNCSCAVSAADGQHVQIDSAFFLLKSSRPCKDWLRINVDNDEETTRCGYIPEQKRFIGHNMNINFVSDGHDTEMGFWLRFSGAGGGPVKVRCGRYFNTDDTVTPTTKAPPTTTTTPTTTPLPTTTDTPTTLSPPLTTVLDTDTTAYTTLADTQTMPTTPESSSEWDRTNDIIGSSAPGTTSTQSSMASTEDVVDLEQSTLGGKKDIRTDPVTKIVMLSSLSPKATEKRLIPVETVHDMVFTSFPSTYTPPTSTTSYTEVLDTTSTVPPTDHTDTMVQATTQDAQQEIVATEDIQYARSEPPTELTLIDEDEAILAEDKLDVVDKVLADTNGELESIEDVRDGILSVEPVQESESEVSDAEQVDIGAFVAPDEADPDPDSDQIPDGKFFLPIADEDDVRWTNAEYVDLDADYDQMLEPIEMTRPPSTIPPTLMTSIGKPTVPTTAPMVHYVHNEPAGAPIETSTFEATEENLDMLIKEMNEEEMKPKAEEPKAIITTPPPTESNPTTNKPVVSVENDESAEIIFESDTSNVKAKKFVEEAANNKNVKEPIDVSIEEPTLIQEPKKDDTYDTEDAIQEVESELVTPYFSQNEIADITGELLLAATDYPLTIREEFRTSPEVRSVDTVDFRSVFNKYRISDPRSTVTPFDWRLSLSKAGFPYYGSTGGFGTTTTTPDEVLHYVSSGAAVRESIATGQFHPIGDIISLIDEKDLSTTTTTPVTTTVAPEIYTLLGALPPGRPINTIGHPLRPFPFPNWEESNRVRDTQGAGPATIAATPSPDSDLADVETENKWRSIGFNRSWIPHMVPAEDPGAMPPFGGKATAEPPKVVPVAVKHSAGSKDLMWVLIVIAIVLWVVFVALLTLLIYHRRRRLTCLRGEDAAAAARRDPRAPFSKNILLPTLSAPLTPGMRTQYSKPSQAETGTQTGNSRLSSALSWSSVSSLPSSSAGAGPSQRRATVSGGLSVRNGQSKSDWSLPRSVQIHHAARSERGTPSPALATGRRAAAATQTPNTRRKMKSNSAQTEVSGSIKVRSQSHRHEQARRRHAPLPPVPVPPPMWGDPQNRSQMVDLNHVEPVHYVHTIMRAMPKGGHGNLKQPPYAESSTDLTKGDVNEDNVCNWAASHMSYPLNVQTLNTRTVGHSPRSRPNGASGRHGYNNNNNSHSTMPEVKVRNKPKSHAVRISDLPLPPPPPECFPSPSSTLQSRKSSAGHCTYSSIKPRQRPRAESNASSVLEYPGYLQDSSCSLGSDTTGGHLYSNTASLGTLHPFSDEHSYANTNSAPASLRETNGNRAKPPILTFPPPPPPLPPTPPPLPARNPPPSNRPPNNLANNTPLPNNNTLPNNLGASSGVDNEVRTLPVGCEDPKETTTPSMTRGKSAPDVASSSDTLDKDDNINLLRMESVPNVNKDSPSEKLKGLVPQQAFFFNDKVQPELRRILSKRRFGNLPVEV